MISPLTTATYTHSKNANKMPLSLSPHSLQLSTVHSSSVTQNFSQIVNPTLPWQPQKHLQTRVFCVSTRPRKKLDPTSQKSEAQELVRVLLRNFSDKQPLVRTLDKYVRIVRTEHCFMLFEELGKSDNWLQCLEVWCFLTLCIESFCAF